MLALPLTALFPLKASACLAVIAVIVVTRISKANHPHAAFGTGNYITAARALLVALIAASVAAPYVADFGPEGIPLTEAKNLTAANTAGPGGRFKIECYAKLTAAGVNINSGASLQ